MEIKVIGSGCKNCHTLLANTKEAVANLGIDAEILYVTDPVEMAKTGVMRTPALIIDGKVVSSGKVLKPAQIEVLIS